MLQQTLTCSFPVESVLMPAVQGWEAIIMISSAVLKGLRVKALCLLSEATGVPSGL